MSRMYPGHRLRSVEDTAREGDDKWEGHCSCGWAITSRTKRGVQKAYSEHANPTGTSVAIGERVTWKEGGMLHRQYRTGSSENRHDPDYYGFEPWTITKVGRRRLHVEGFLPREYGYLDRDEMERRGWGIVYRGYQSVAAVHAPWSEDYAKWKLYQETQKDLLDDKRRYNPDTLGGSIRLRKRMGALAVLGLPVTADAKTVKATYRRLAKENHPDRGGDPERFMAIQDAWESLQSDELTLKELIDELTKRWKEENEKV